MLRRKHFRASSLVLLIVLLFSPLGESCPLVCICKWKGGKQTVSCRNQALETLPDGIDPETQVLDISGNKLGVLPRDAFRRAGLLNLQKIHVSNSRLTQIDQGAFSELINLVEIDLSDNLLGAVPSTAFKETPFVRDLNLGGNPIKRLKAGAFRHLSQLVKLDLSRCQLYDIEDEAFAHLQLLETFKFNSNLLPVLSNNTVKALSQLHGMDLHDNPWECDCRLRDLKMLIETKNIPHTVSPSCHSPPRLAGRRFSELPLSEFACPPKILEGGKQISVFEGDNATFDCIFQAIPHPQVRWYLFGRPIINNTLLSFSRKFLIFEEPHKSTLILTNTNTKDGGDFFCVVENPGGFVESNFTLEILPPPPYQNILDTSHLLIVALASSAILCILLIVAVIFLLYRCRLARRSQERKSNGVQGGSSGNGGVNNLTPVKPPRINNYESYEINPGSLVHQNGGFIVKSNNKGLAESDNPDLILETNNSNNVGAYQENTQESESLHSELNWEQQSYRNLAYTTEYPTDYGLPIIHENSVYSDSTSFYGDGGQILNHNGGGGGSINNLSNGISVRVPPPQVMSGVWNKNKVGARITAPNSRDSPDEGYQEGYVGTDV